MTPAFESGVHGLPDRPPESATDPFMKLAGMFESGVPDAAEKHHEYLGQALYDELQGHPSDAARVGGAPMSERILIPFDLPDDLSRFRLPAGVQARLTELLDRQDAGTPLTAAERAEAEGLVSLADALSLLKLRAERAAG